MSAKIILGNGESMDIEYDDLEALVANGLLEVIERNEAGLPIKVRITQDGYDFAKDCEDEELADEES